jgi:Na+-transporting methylmalonyl-CoA/oxaloacetate decarboxylase beta subunit
MIRKLALIANILALITIGSPILFIGFILLKHNDAASVGIIGGADGPTTIFYSFSFDPFRIIPLILLITLLCLNIYVIKKNKSGDAWP